MNPKVDFYFSKAKKWQKEIETLRSIVLDCGLEEELKWGCPCYTHQAGNIVLIHVFKEYCAFLFFKGALLNDAEGILVQQTENVQSARQVRFTGLQEIVKMKSMLKAYIYEAIEVEKAGLKVKLKKTAEFKMPEEFKKKFLPQKILLAGAIFNSRWNATTRVYDTPRVSQILIPIEGVDHITLPKIDTPFMPKAATRSLRLSAICRSSCGEKVE